MESREGCVLMIASIVEPLVGGALIGLAASWLLVANGQVAGISGILGDVLGPWNSQSAWRFSFIVGLLCGGVCLTLVMPSAIAFAEERPLILMAVAGLFVGYGTRLGSGCTSGHGICGLTRFSPRSLVATLTFMATGAAAATLMAVLS